jgi:flagellar biosynthetic protein FliR
VLIFVSNMHHMMLRGLVESYSVFRPNELPPIADLADIIVRLVSSSFLLGIQIATPFMAFGFIFYLALGLIARLMPQVQIFFVAMPLQIVIGVLVLGSTVGVGMVIFLSRFESVLSTFSLTP